MEDQKSVTAQKWDMVADTTEETADLNKTIGRLEIDPSKDRSERIKQLQGYINQNNELINRLLEEIAAEEAKNITAKTTMEQQTGPQAPQGFSDMRGGVHRTREEALDADAGYRDAM